ncbi:hypothetical protein [Hazenella coriacea]|uniref:Uncharacterized protein n=1 Tax=Hazenella coriacea TaxID=1179467 RepID=A0A4R3L363_9BACL|nr:hypothetical protein [Hazenella coriacea]TCS93672.1 hypothetical protein EDD58_106105 [Hazenella coriacea]
MNHPRIKNEKRDQSVLHDEFQAQKVDQDEELEDGCLDIRIPAHQVMDPPE